MVRDDAPNPVVLFERLSSGEQRLITLAANVSAKAAMRMVMLVDEPGLSLHVRWQRAIPPSLAELSEHFSSAFVAATHSLVVIASTSDDDHCFVAAEQVLDPIKQQPPSVESVLFEEFDTYTTNT